MSEHVHNGWLQLFQIDIDITEDADAPVYIETSYEHFGVDTPARMRVDRVAIYSPFLSGDVPDMRVSFRGRRLTQDGKVAMARSGHAQVVAWDSPLLDPYRERLTTAIQHRRRTIELQMERFVEIITGKLTKEVIK